MARSPRVQNELKEEHKLFSPPRYGNYVVQSIAERTDSPFRPKVIDTIIDKIPELAVDKFASNVAERALIHSSVDDRSRIIERVGY